MIIKSIIAFIVLIISLLAYYKKRKYGYQRSQLQAEKIKTEVISIISELQVLQNQISPLYSEPVLQTLNERLGDTDQIKEMYKAAEDFENEVDETLEAQSLLESAPEGSLDAVLLVKLRTRVKAMISHERKVLNSVPPTMLNLIQGKDLKL